MHAGGIQTKFFHLKYSPNHVLLTGKRPRALVMPDYNEHMMSSDSLITHLTLKEKTATPTENSKTDLQCQDVETGCEKGGFRFADI